MCRRQWSPWHGCQFATVIYGEQDAVLSYLLTVDQSNGLATPLLRRKDAEAIYILMPMVIISLGKFCRIDFRAAKYWPHLR